MELTLDQALKNGIEAHKAVRYKRLIVIIKQYLQPSPTILMPIIIWGDTGYWCWQS